MNIVVFSPTWPKQGDANGIVTYCSHLVFALKGMGHNVYVLAITIADDAEDFVYPVSYKPLLPERLWLKLRDYFSPGYSQYYLGAKAIVAGIDAIQKEHSIDIMEIEESFGWHYLIQREVGFPVVMRLHGPHYVSASVGGGVLQKIDYCRFKREKKAFQAALYVNAPSQWILDKVEKENAISWPLSTVFFNPIEPLSIDKCWGRVPYNQHQILFVGRFDALKGGDLVLNAFAQVLVNIPTAVLKFVGPDRGLKISDNEILHIEEAIKQVVPLSYQSQVQYLGLLEKDQIEALRQSSHITIMASKSEVFGYTVLEALASASPIIATSVGGVCEILDDNESGILFESGDVDDLSKKIEFLLSDDNAAQEIAECGYKKCIDHFSSATVVKHAVDYYGRVIEADQC
jgi:glycosyltransferase involved in cell wall biosynthesis